MKQKNLAMLGVAVGCGLVAAIAVAKLSARSGNTADTVKVLVAKKDIPIGTKLDDKDLDGWLTWAEVPSNLVPPDVVSDIEYVKNKVVNRTLKMNNPVAMTDVGMPQGIPLPEGTKQITIKSTQVDAVAGFARPGSKVDVMYIERSPTGKWRAAIILRDMLILAINREDQIKDEQGHAIASVESVSMAVSDKQATMVALAEQKGTLKLVLRGEARSAAKKIAGDENKIEWMDDPFDSTPTVVTAPPELPVVKYDSAVIVKKAVPLNTLVNVDNVREFFDTIELKAAPDGVEKSLVDLQGKFVIKPLDPGQFMYKSLVGNAAVKVDPLAFEVPPTPSPTPMAPPVAEVVKQPDPKKMRQFEQVFQQGSKATRVLWFEVAPEKWKQFESEKDADKYKADNAAPEKVNEKSSAVQPVG